MYIQRISIYLWIVYLSICFLSSIFQLQCNPSILANIYMISKLKKKPMKDIMIDAWECNFSLFYELTYDRPTDLYINSYYQTAQYTFI